MTKAISDPLSPYTFDVGFPLYFSYASLFILYYRPTGIEFKAFKPEIESLNFPSISKSATLSPIFKPDKRAALSMCFVNIAARLLV